MSEITEVYKVVSQNLKSARWGDVQYELNNFVYAPGNTKLFCFENLIDASNFIEHHGKYSSQVNEVIFNDDERLFRAEALDAVPGANCIKRGDNSLIPKFWKNGGYLTENDIFWLGLVGPAPDGTLFASAIKLVEEINPNLE